MLKQKVKLYRIVSSIQTNDPVLVIHNILTPCVLVLVKTEFCCAAECLVQLFLVLDEHD